jgi:hypothetical protein
MKNPHQPPPTEYNKNILSGAEHRDLLTQAGFTDVRTTHVSGENWICARDKGRGSSKPLTPRKNAEWPPRLTSRDGDANRARVRNNPQTRSRKYPTQISAAQIQTMANSRTRPPASTECKTKGIGIRVKKLAHTNEAVRQRRRAK